MKNTIKELWYGNALPNQGEMNTEYRALLREYIRCSEKYEPMLSKETFDLICEQKEIASQMGGALEAEAFVKGFCLGARLMIEVYRNDE